MAAADVQSPPSAPVANEPTPGVPDYLASPNAIFNDTGVKWRYGKAPDYSKTRKVWEEGKKMNHAAGSLPQLVENLVKNWEVEASFKPRLQDWRTVDHEKYSFAINGGPPQSGEHMLKVGTYNAIIAPNEYYSPENSDFASSHKTFKRMMPTFAWEVMEVYSGPPQVAFKWRHWGVMENDYVGFNDKGEKVVAKAHGGPIEIFGVTVARVDDKVRLQDVDTWFDPLDMFRQIAPHGVVNKEFMNRKVDLEAALDVGTSYVPAKPENAESEVAKPDITSAAQSQEAAQPVAATQHLGEPVVPENDGIKIAQEYNQPGSEPKAPEEVVQKHISDRTGKPADAFVPHQGADTEKPVAESNPASSVPASQVVEAAATQGAEAEIEHPESNFHDAQEQLSEAVENGDSAAKTEQPATASSIDVPRSIYSSSVTGDLEDRVKAGKTGEAVNGVAPDESLATGSHDAVDEHLEGSSEQVHPHPHDTEKAVQPNGGEAIALPAQAEETHMTHEEMSTITPTECPFLMNRE
ncbi:hypothetical protein LTR85_000716 [Meristemomyces frigidus]|nr:hypothetical protein LTR85_000716 [Meristemomyces frigidus]